MAKYPLFLKIQKAPHVFQTYIIIFKLELKNQLKT